MIIAVVYIEGGEKEKETVGPFSISRLLFSSLYIYRPLDLVLLRSLFPDRVEGSSIAELNTSGTRTFKQSDVRTEPKIYIQGCYHS